MGRATIRSRELRLAWPAVVIFLLLGARARACEGFLAGALLAAEQARWVAVREETILPEEAGAGTGASVPVAAEAVQAGAEASVPAPAEVAGAGASAAVGAPGSASPTGQTVPIQIDGTAPERIRAFYRNTVFAGDSVLAGFRNYCASGDEVLRGLHFLAAGSYSLHNAFWPVGGKSVHPRYEGEQMPLWESIPKIAPERIFLFFGINDVVYGVEDSVKKYEALIAKIREAHPTAVCYIISATYLVEGAEKKNLNNANLAEFNRIMAEKAGQNGWGYVDVATPTSDGRGNLKGELCTDGFVHQNRKAYQIWEKVFRDYALTETEGDRK